MHARVPPTQRRYHTNNGWNDSYGEDIGKNGWDDPNPHTFVAKTDLGSSNILWQTFLDADWAKRNNYTEYGRTRLTDVIPLPGTDYLLVTDGYGSSYIHVLNKTDGAYVPGMSFGGRPTFACERCNSTYKKNMIVHLNPPA